MKKQDRKKPTNKSDGQPGHVGFSLPMKNVVMKPPILSVYYPCSKVCCVMIIGSPIIVTQIAYIHYNTYHLRELTRAWE